MPTKPTKAPPKPTPKPTPQRTEPLTLTMFLSLKGSDGKMPRAEELDTDAVQLFGGFDRARDNGERDFDGEEDGFTVYEVTLKPVKRYRQGFYEVK